ncbi:hypothetical protein MLD38_036273 [Melastoma candidum]|uniref:Uncharacterized protein n=1 Tax=Melastoma candidum TaxID=119954 RepID=A0ACB9LJ50_9MYRT|nr:hypothetical protein MLD38_036273 [Melastoma candidum]
MKLDVQVEVVDKIKPSSPTLPHLRRHDFSFLDQIANPYFMPFILFYHNDSLTTLEKKLAQVKSSLSKALSIFYPLAGKMKSGQAHVDCNDRGIHYVEARANCLLSEVLEDREPELLKPLVPFGLCDVNDMAAGVQVTSFGCGGLAVCLCISHKVGDALSCILFLNCWAAISRGDEDCESFVPDFGSVKLFPAIELPDQEKDDISPIIKEGLVTKRFVFGPTTISSLRDKYANPERQIRPSRVEALKAFILQRHMETMQRTKYVLIEPVNLRQRTTPRLSFRHFGNIIVAIKNVMDLSDVGEREIVSQVRERIRGVDMGCVKQIQDTSEYLKQEEKITKESRKGNMLPILFTSLCRFPMYDADIGWGKPAWVSTVGMPHSHMVSFWDGKDGESIEVYVTLGAEDMSKFEKDKELLSYTSSR